MGLRGTSVGYTAPAVGDSETAASQAVTDALTELITRSEAQVTIAEIDIDATLDFQTQAAENVTYIETITQGSKPTPTETLYNKLVGSVDELFYQDSDGTEVQITNAGSLNVSATGAITGTGYGSGGVAVNWNSAGTNYQIKSGSGADDYAAVTCDGLQLRDGSSHAVTLDCPSISASYTINMPTALPAAEVVASLDASGNLAVADTSTPRAAYKYATTEQTLHLAKAFNMSGSWTTADTGVSNGATSSSQELVLPLDVVVGEVIDEYKVNVRTNSGTDTINANLRYVNAAGSMTTVSSGSTAATGDIENTGIGHTVATNRSYFIYIQYTAAGGSSVNISHASISTNQP